MNLKKIRNQIDVLDARIVRLLNERMEMALLSKKFKKEIEDKSRENNLLERIQKLSPALIDSEFSVRLFQSILEESKKLQATETPLLAFHGEHGAFSELAALKWETDTIPISCRQFPEMVQAIEETVYEYGIVPVENSIGGKFKQAEHMIFQHSLNIIAEIDMEINHCIMIIPEANFREIKKVYSHAQVLEVTRRFLARNHLDGIPFYDTGGAARFLSESRLTDSAVIGSKLAADIYKLEIIKENVEDQIDNITRFLIVSKMAQSTTGNRCLLTIKPKSEEGILPILEQIKKHGIIVERLELNRTLSNGHTHILELYREEKALNSEEVDHLISEHVESCSNLGCFPVKKVRS